MAKFEIITPVKGSVLSLETKRLTLSVFKPSACGAVTDYLVRNRAFHKKYSQMHKERYFTVAEQKLFLKSDLHMYNRNEMVPFWITKTGEPERIIGRISFYSIIGGSMNTCYVGYHIDEKCRGQGYMREALEAGCAFMFRYYKLHRIEADIIPTNEKSRNCVINCGFEKMGYNIRFMEIDGTYQDHEMYVLLNPEVENVISL